MKVCFAYAAVVLICNLVAISPASAAYVITFYARGSTLETITSGVVDGLNIDTHTTEQIQHPITLSFTVDPSAAATLDVLPYRLTFFGGDYYGNTSPVTDNQLTQIGAPPLATVAGSWLGEIIIQTQDPAPSVANQILLTNEDFWDTSSGNTEGYIKNYTDVSIVDSHKQNITQLDLSSPLTNDPYIVKNANAVAHLVNDTFYFDHDTGDTLFSSVGIYFSPICVAINGNGPCAALNAIPEPSTWSMLLLGFGGLGFALRRSRNAAKAPIKLPP